MTTPHTPPAALDLMSADEARSLLAAMTPGTLEVAEIRDGRLIDAAAQELAVVIHDDARAHQKPDGTWHSVVVCRGMDGPTRDGNAAALASVKRALEAVVALAAQHAADVAAAVAAERARARRCTIYSERFDGCSMIDALQAARGMIENGEDDEVCEYCHDTGVNAASSKPCRCCEWARVLAADALAAPTGGGE